MALYSALGWKDFKSGKPVERVETFLDKFDGKEDFILLNGKKTKISKIKVNKNVYPPGSSELRSSWMSQPAKLGTVRFLRKNKAELKWGELAKTAEFGGKGAAAKTGKVATGGVITEVLSEVGFCFYYAMLVNGHLDSYTPEVWKEIKNTAGFKILCKQFTGVSTMLTYEFNDVKALDSQLSKMYSFLTNEKWHDVLIAQTKAFKNKYNGVGKSYFLARPSALPTNINPYTPYSNLATSLKEMMGLSRKIDPNKWNPADFWIFSNNGLRLVKQWVTKSRRFKAVRSETYTSSYMNLVNRQLLKLYKAGDVYPVSLKKSGMSPRIIEVNSANVEIEQTIEYDKVVLSATNQDVQIFYKLKTFDNNKLVSDKLMYAKMKTLAGGFRLELYQKDKDSEARHGSIGVGIQSFIIKNTADSGIKQVEDIRDEYPQLKGIVPLRNSMQWLGTNKYIKIGLQAEQLLPYLNKMMEAVNGPGVNSEFKLDNSDTDAKRAEKIATKTGASEIAIAVTKILNKHARDITIENLHLAAGSAGVQVGASPQQLKSRFKFLGMKEDDIISLREDTKAFDALLEAGFHLKIL
tara:strand:+ start:19 stop:1752 length:1734 start_codon:yes stop_codon:yes gene_type:complete